MTSPQAPADPQAPQGTAPAGGQAPEGQQPSGGQGPAQGQPGGSGQAPADDGELARLRAALAHERDARKRAQDDLTAAQQAAMTEDEKKLAKARDEGRAEARREHGLALAAAEFKLAAHGKIADPEAALEVIDLAKFVTEAGEVDKGELAKLIDRLAATLPSANGAGKVPPGARGGPADGGDFLRTAMGGKHPRG